jgi:16S rRNA (cytosine1402-N4)-methyltransferase
VISTKTKTKMPKQKQIDAVHQPVLLQAVLDVLAPKPGQSYLDLTAGYGGHSSAILRATQAVKGSVLVDRDEQAITALREQFGSTGAQIMHRDFESALRELDAKGKKFDIILADLGVSSPHLEDAQRGFAFSLSGPLDMRMDIRQELDAERIVNESKEDELANILARFGEEPKARAIAKAIISSRPVKSTDQLAAIIAKAAGFRARHAKIHPATRSFQALRIAVNNELEQLTQSLPLMLDLLSPGGRMAVISFHSLEDRIVKQFLADRAGNRYDSELQILTKRPITASHDEIVSNPRARSAKLRAAAKIKTKERVEETQHAYQGKR